MKINKNGSQYIFGKHDLFSVVIAVRYLLPQKDFLLFKKELVKAFTIFTITCQSFSENELLNSMGFPPNWKTITRYSI